MINVEENDVGNCNTNICEHNSWKSRIKKQNETPFIAEYSCYLRHKQSKTVGDTYAKVECWRSNFNVQESLSWSFLLLSH